LNNKSGLIVFFSLFFILFSSGSVSGAVECDISGEWDSNWGLMNLEQSGSSVSGSYTWDDGKISGSYSGGILTGEWSESPSYSPPDDAGGFVFTISDDCNSFSGTWGYGSESTGGGWSATRVNPKQLQLPQRQQPR
jgi:hypothetical protein